MVIVRHEVLLLQWLSVPDKEEHSINIVVYQWYEKEQNHQSKLSYEQWIYKNNRNY